MLWGRSERADLYLGRRRLAWAVAGAPAQSLAHDFGPDGWGAVHGLIDGHRKSLRLRVWLEASLAVPFLLERVQGVRGDEELRLVAQSMAQSLTGLDEPCEVWCEPAQEAGPLVAVAMPARVLHGVRSLTTRAKGRLAVESVRPWWAHVQSMAVAKHPQARCVLIQEADAVTLVAANGSRIDHVDSAWSFGSAEGGEAAATRLLAAMPSAAPQVLRARMVWPGVSQAPGAAADLAGGLSLVWSN